MLRKTVFIIMMLFILFVFCSCNLFKSSPTKIKNGFSDELKTMLFDRYEIFIPSEADFISGYYDNAWQDNSVHISFSIPQEKFERIFINNWIESTGSSDLFTEYDKDYIGYRQYEEELYTAIAFAESEDGSYLVDFLGRNPGNSIN